MVLNFSITDSPFYTEGRPMGDNLHRLASGVQVHLRDARGDVGMRAGKRLVSAAFQLRAALIGLRMARIASAGEVGRDFSDALGEYPQIVHHSGRFLGMSALQATLDLCAATIYRLHYGDWSADYPEREADMESFPADKELVPKLTPGHRDWLTATKSHHLYAALKVGRAGIQHQSPNVHSTIGAVFRPELETVDGKLTDELAEALTDFVIDRYIALGRLLVQYE